MTSEDLITLKLVKSTLASDRGSHAELTNWSHENCSKLGENFFNVCKRIYVEFTENGVPKKTSYVAKINPRKKDDIFDPYRHRAVIKEVFFYKDLLPLLNAELEVMKEDPLNVPKYLFSYTNTPGEEIIVFEDLQRKDYITFDRSNKMDEEHSKVMAKELAKLHAASFLLQKKYPSTPLTDVFPLLIESWCIPDPALSVGFSEFFDKGTRHNLKLMESLGGYDDLIPWMEKLSAKGEGIRALKKELPDTAPWSVICHGDFHRTNVLFRYENNKPVQVMVLDWQTVRLSSIGMEVAYFGMSCFFNPLRDILFPQVERMYYSKLNSLMENAHEQLLFSFDDMVEKVSKNNFGLLLCFFCIPLSMCVKTPSELFDIAQTEDEKIDNEIILAERGISILKENGLLKDVLNDHLSEIRKRKIDLS